jgi:hypothetical protein
MTARKIVEKCAELNIIRSRFAELFAFLIIIGGFLHNHAAVVENHKPFLLKVENNVDDEIIGNRSDDRFIFTTMRC